MSSNVFEWEACDGGGLSHSGCQKETWHEINFLRGLHPIFAIMKQKLTEGKVSCSVSMVIPLKSSVSWLTRCPFVPTAFSLKETK